MKSKIKEKILEKLEEDDKSLKELRKLGIDKTVNYQIANLVNGLEIIPYIVPPAHRVKDIKYRLVKKEFDNPVWIKKLFILMQDEKTNRRAAEVFYELWKDRGLSESPGLVDESEKGWVEEGPVNLSADKIVKLVESGFSPEFESKLAFYLSTKDKEKLLQYLNRIRGEGFAQERIYV